MDENTGDPVLDELFDLIEVTNAVGFEQIIDGVLHCDLGSELMNQSYGFDLKSAIRESGQSNSEMFIESLVLQALDPQKEILISSVDYIRATRDEDNARQMNVELVITSVFDETIEATQTIGG